MITDCRIDKSTPIPLYYQLKTLLLDQIKSGEYMAGDLIPTEAELGSIFDISRTTVRQAISELVREGYLYRVPSKGTFVSKPRVTLHVSESVYTFLKDVRESGHESTVEVLEKKLVSMPQELIDLGAGTAGDQAIYLHRKRYLNGVPLDRTETYLPYSLFRDLLEADLAGRTLRQWMDSKPETKVMCWKRAIESVAANAEDARVLGVQQGSPMLKMHTIRYGAEDKVLDISSSYLRGEMSRVEIQVVNDD